MGKPCCCLALLHASVPASNSRQVLERCAYMLQLTKLPTWPVSATQREGIFSVFRMQTRCWFTGKVMSAGTVPNGWAVVSDQ